MAVFLLFNLPFDWGVLRILFIFGGQRGIFYSILVKGISNQEQIKSTRSYYTFSHFDVVIKKCVTFDTYFLILVNVLLHFHDVTFIFSYSDLAFSFWPRYFQGKTLKYYLLVNPSGDGITWRILKKSYIQEFIYHNFYSQDWSSTIPRKK